MSYVFFNIIGFLFQIIPSMALLFLPIPVTSYRVPRRRVAIVFTALSAAAAVYFPFAVRGAYASLFGSIYAAANTYMLFMVLLGVLLWMLTVREAVLKKMIVICFALFYAAAQYMTVNLFTDVAFPGGDVYPPKVVLLYAVSAAVLFPAFTVLLRKAVKPWLAEINPKNMKAEFILLLIFISFFIMELYFFTASPEPDHHTYWLYMATSFIYFIVVMGLFFWVLFRESVRRQRDAEKWRQYELQQMQYQKITADIENARRMRHDLRHHIGSLSELAQRGKIEEIKSYLAELGEQYRRVEQERFCKNESLNSILQYYIGSARENGIRCSVSADCGETAAASAADLTVLFGNMLENAIHACMESEGSLEIIVKVGSVGGSFAAIVENTCDKVKTTGKHTAPDAFLPPSAFVSIHKGGGNGLRSIAAMADKYDGDAAFRYNPETRRFTSRIRLNSQKANQNATDTEER